MAKPSFLKATEFLTQRVSAGTILKRLAVVLPAGLA